MRILKYNNGTIRYSSRSRLSQPGLLATQLLRDLRASREIGWLFLVRNLRVQYRRSLLGYLWAVLPPLASMLSWVYLNMIGVLKVGAVGVPYPIYVLSGTVLWQAFLDALNTPLNQLSANRSLLIKVNFPREALVLAGMGEVLFNFCIRLVLLLAAFVWAGVSIPQTIVLVPLGVLALLLLGLSIGLLLVPIGLLYEDVQRAIGIFATAWFLLTPIVYHQSVPWLPGLLALNPLTPLLVTTRDWLTTGVLAPSPGAGWVVLVSMAVLAGGWGLFSLAFSHIVPRLGAR